MGKRGRRRQRSRAAVAVGVAARPAAPTERLHGLVERRNELEREIEEETDRLAATGIGWPAIAAALGLSRQGARQARYGATNAPDNASCRSSRRETSVYAEQLILVERTRLERCPLPRTPARRVQILAHPRRESQYGSR